MSRTTPGISACTAECRSKLRIAGAGPLQFRWKIPGAMTSPRSGDLDSSFIQSDSVLNTSLQNAVRPPGPRRHRVLGPPSGEPAPEALWKGNCAEGFCGGIRGMRRTGYCAELFGDASLIEEYETTESLHCAFWLTIAKIFPTASLKVLDSYRESMMLPDSGMLNCSPKRQKEDKPCDRVGPPHSYWRSLRVGQSCSTGREASGHNRL